MVRDASILALLSLAAPLTLAADNPPNAEEIVEQAMPSIVAIRAETPVGISSGTGFIVDPSGVIVTNMHVIEDARRAAVKLHTGEQFTRVMVSSYDEERDLAIIRIPGFDLPTLQLGNSDTVKVGATVYAIGNPLGLEESVTKGIVSSVRVRDDGTKVIQTDSAVSSGNSGGPLIDDHGQVVGIVTFKVRGGESLNFAVPVNYARALLGIESLMTLDEFTREVAKENVSLFEDEEIQASSIDKWLSLTSNTLRELSVSGEYIYGSWNFDDKAAGTINNGTYDLKRAGENTYEGEATAHWNCWYYRFGKKVENFCTDKVKTELTLVAPDRIEGRMYGERGVNPSDRGFKKACDSCNDNQPSDWQEFVWVRED